MNIQFNIKQFKNNRRSIWGVRVFFFFALISLFAQFIANDKPLVIFYKNQLYFPIFSIYTEQDFGRDFSVEADYSEGAFKDQICQDGWMIWPLIPYRYDTINYDLNAPAPTAPDSNHWLGTDEQGRDLLACLIYGVQFSILFGLALMTISAVVGFFLGALQGYFGGYVDLLLQRFMEIWSGLPVLLVLMVVSGLTAPTFGWLLFITSLFKWMLFVPVVRAEFLRARNIEYVKAAKAMGIRPMFIIFRHILPNVIGAPLSLVPFMLTVSIGLFTTLDLLGLGLPSGEPSLGEILHQGKNNLNAPWIGISGISTLCLLLGSLIFIGEGIREAFRSKKVSFLEGV